MRPTKLWSSSIHMLPICIHCKTSAICMPWSKLWPPLLQSYFVSVLTQKGDMRGVQPLAALDGCQLLLRWWRRCNERGGDSNVRFCLLATSKLFSQGRERGSSVCAWYKRTPQRSYENVSPTKKTRRWQKHTGSNMTEYKGKMVQRQ